MERMMASGSLPLSMNPGGPWWVTPHQHHSYPPFPGAVNSQKSDYPWRPGRKGQIPRHPFGTEPLVGFVPLFEMTTQQMDMGWDTSFSLPMSSLGTHLFFLSSPGSCRGSGRDR